MIIAPLVFIKIWNERRQTQRSFQKLLNPQSLFGLCLMLGILPINSTVCTKWTGWLRGKEGGAENASVILAPLLTLWVTVDGQVTSPGQASVAFFLNGNHSQIY